VKLHAAIASVVIAVLGAPPPVHAGQSPWAALLVNDIEAMHEALRESHPGAVDTLNKDFARWLEAGYRQARERAKTCDSYEGYRFALEAYAFGFHDAHVGAGTDLRRDGVRWPGFMAGWRSDDGKLIVRSVGASKGGASKDGTSKDGAKNDGPGLPPIGSEIVSCDGRPVRDLIERDVLPFTGNPPLDFAWEQAAPLLLIDESNPWRGPMPKTCQIVDKGVAREHVLAWRWIDYPGMRVHRAAARERLDLAFVIRPFGEHGIWVGMPTFSALNDAAIAGMKAAIAQAPAWRDRDPIVFDVRNNGGGSSVWGEQLLQALYGKDFFAARTAALGSKEYVEWRVSPANLAFIEKLRAENTRRGGAVGDAWSNRIIAGLTRARAAGKSLWREDREPEPPAADAKALPNPVRGRVFLLTDSACTSACLDFADRVRALPGTQHVGRTTNADSVYMEAREFPLPSGIAGFTVAMKVYRNRPRGNNQPYVPHHAWKGSMADTAGLERWILSLPAPR
jgi:hypothetical protein